MQDMKLSREGRSVANFNGTIDCPQKVTAENMFLVERSRKHGFGEIHGRERCLFSTSAGLLSRLPVTFGIVPERLDGFSYQDLAAADSEWDQLFANPADQGQTVMYSMINFHSGYFHDDIFLFDAGLVGR